MLIAEKKQREREAQKELAAAAPQWQPIPPYPVDEYEELPPYVEPVPVIPSGPIRIEHPYVEACEKELLSFVLEDGCAELEFDKDSKYYTEERVTVADFIDGTLADGDLIFLNPSYEKVYETYFEMYQEGLTQQQIQNRAILRNAMTENGFQYLPEEWWHFVLENEPYPDTYFDFPITSPQAKRI